MKTKKIKEQPENTVRQDSDPREFSLYLPMTVSGVDAQGQEFREDSVLSSISSEQASFLLKTKVEFNSLLKLTIPLPPKLADGQPLALVLKGKVKAMQPVSGKQGSQLLIQLDSRYFIGSEDHES